MSRDWATRLRALLADEKQRATLLVVAGVAGMLLLAATEWLPKPEQAEQETVAEEAAPQSSADYARELEKRLQELIAAVEGAGDTRVMVTLATGENTRYATDVRTQADSYTEEHVLLQGGSPPALVETVATPEVQGVAVLCEGGGEALVQSRITEIVRVLTGVNTNHITVTKLVPESRAASGTGSDQP